MSGALDRRALLGGLMLALPLVAGAILFALVASTGLQRTYTLFLINLIAVIGLGVFSGNSGILSFGHVSFIGLGAYISGILTLPVDKKASYLPQLPDFMADIALSLPGALLVTLAVVAVVAVLIGIPIVRMGGAAAVIATLGLLLIVHGTIIGATDFTRGSNAFMGVARLTSIWLALGLAVPVILLARWYRDSRRGSQLRASREDETAARAIGIDVVRRRLGAWIVSAVICAAAGVLLAHFLGAFSPTAFYFDGTLTLITMLIVGGMTTVSGAVAGTVVVTLTVEVLRRVEGGIELFGWETPEVFGLTQLGLCLLILLVMYRRPAGLFGNREIGESWLRAPMAAAANPAPKTAAGGALRVEAVTKDFSGLRALENVALEIRPGEIVGLIGPNGSGKTTLLNVVSGVLFASAGRVLVDGADATRWPAHVVAQAGIGRTFQNIRLFGHLSVLENVAIAAGTRSGDSAAARATAQRLLAEFGLGTLADRRAGELDYGAQRRLEIARALALGPRYLLLDEPAAGMNPTESNQLLAELAALRQRTGIALLVIDHDMSLIMRLCDRIVVLNRGQVIAEGKPAEIQSDPKVIEAYIGRKRAARAAPIPPVQPHHQAQTQGATP